MRPKLSQEQEKRFNDAAEAVQVGNALRIFPRIVRFHRKCYTELLNVMVYTDPYLIVPLMMQTLPRMYMGVTLSPASSS
jgi:hypothetical protein